MNKFKHIVVVGDGSAGCMAACYFANNTNFKVTLVSSGKEGIGVGEATLTGFDDFLEECGLTSQDWFPKVEATIKNGILFKNWRTDGKDVWHPFVTDMSVYHERGINPGDVDYDTYLKESYNYNKCVINNEVANNCKAAFHVDALKMVRTLKDRFVKFDNTSIVTGFVTELKEASGDITAVTITSADGNKIVLDDSLLVIDSTGFGGMKKLLPDVLQGTYLSTKERLKNNAAIASPIAYTEGKAYHPYTKASAVDEGWIWEIPIQSRIGSGIVYDSDVTSDEEALSSFNSFHNVNLNKEDVNLIKYTPEILTNQWRGNLVNIGLSSGFIEPLESSGLALFIEGITHLFEEVRRGYYMPTNRDIFNSLMFSKYDEAAEFVSAHYTNRPSNKRTDIPLLVTEENLRIYNNQKSIPNPSNDYMEVWHSLFHGYSWAVLFEGFMMDGHSNKRTHNVESR